MNKFIKVLITLSALLCAGCTTDADGDDFDAGKVCPVEGVNVYGMPNRGTFIDERDGREYKYTTIGNRMWMAENLNYDCDYGYCYEVDSIPNFCENYGRMYNLYKGKNYKGLLDWNRVDNVCPAGWHVPTKNEWLDMIEIMGGEKSPRFLNESFISSRSEYGDVCSLSFLATGYINFSYNLSDFQLVALFWTSTQKDEIGAETVLFCADAKKAMLYPSMPRQSIRCIKD